MMLEKTENVGAHRRRAMESFRSILDFLTGKDALQRFVQIGDRFELNLEKNIPSNPYHRNLILIFEPTLTSGGAKFSLRSDGRFTITVFIPFRNTKEMWKSQFPRYVREWFLGRRSSYIHEFTHYLDIRETKLDKIVPPDPRDNKAYYNHPFEVRAFTQQALSDIEDDVEVKLLNQRKHWVREFGMTEDQFVASAIRKYFNPEFIRYLSPENKRVVEGELRDLYPELTKALKEMPVVNEDNVLKRILQPPVSPNLTLKMAYQDQKDQEEADKDMSKKAIMQYVREVARKMVDEAFGAKDSNTEKGEEWKDIDKLEKLVQVMPDDEPDQKKQPIRNMKDMFPHAANLGGVNQQFGESSTFGSDSFQGSAFGFGGKQQLADPERHVPPEEDDTTEMQLPSSRSRGGLNNPNSGPDKYELGSEDLTDDDEGLIHYTSLAEFLDSIEEQAIAGAEDFSMSTGVGTGGPSQQGIDNTVTERTESDALYRDLHGMAVDPDANDKNFDPEPPAPEEYGSAHHVGGMGKIMAPYKFVPEGKQPLNEKALRLYRHHAEEQAYRARLMKLGKI